MSAHGNSQAVPSIFTNESFLRAAAGPDWERVKVTMFAGDPRKQPRGSWQGFPAVDMLKAAHAHLNTYCSVGVQTGTSRGLAGFEKTFMLVIDDAGTKADLSRAEDFLGRPPNYVLETSPGNHQAGWFTELTDLAWAIGLVRNLYEAMGRQADNLKNLVTYVRLPVGTNWKAHLGPKGFRCRLTRWAPDDRTMDWIAIESRIGRAVPVSVRLSRSAAVMPDPGDVEADAVLQAFRLLGMVQGTGRVMTMGWGFDVDCPWVEEHSDRAREGASYVPVKQRFRCHHGHCQDRTMGDVRARLDELLRDDSGGANTLAGLEFDPVDPQELPQGSSPAAASGTKTAVGRALASYEATEDGLADAFAAQHAGRLRFDHVRQRWFIWTGGFWRQDTLAHAFSWARELARRFRATQETALRPLARIAVAGAIERAARADPRLATDGLSWDRDPWLAGALGCEIDLRTGAVGPPDPAHLVTKQLLVAPSDMATPIWDQFLWDSTGGDPELIRFLQAWSGYCLTGDISEEKFVFLYGPGGNGKGTYLFTINAILHDYAARTPADMFMVRKHEAHSEEVARLAGVRAITATEIEEGRTFNVVRLKDFTGRDGQLLGAFKYKDTFQFTPQFKVTFVGNNQPRLTNVDDAMRRRVILIPFLEKPAVADITLKDRLIAEYPGILRWMIEGENLRRAIGGLTALVPATATLATSAYLDEQDTLKAWAEERCVFGPKEQMGVTKGFEDYRAWCAARGDHNLIGIQEFSRKFLELFPRCQKNHTRLGRVLEGVSLSQQDVDL